MKTTKIVLVLFICTCLILAVSPQAKSQVSGLPGQEKVISKAKIEFKITVDKNNRDLKKKISDPTKIELIKEIYTVKENDKISNILEKKGMHADVNSFGLTQEMNPEIHDLNLIVPGDIINLPVIDISLLNEEIDTEGTLFAFKYAIEKKSSIKSNVENMTAIIDKISALDISRFDNPDIKNELILNLSSIQLFYKNFEEKSFPGGVETLEYIIDDVEALNSILTEIEDAEFTIGPEFNENVKTHKFTTDLLQNCPDSWYVDVVVKIVDENGEEFNNSRVYYKLRRENDYKSYIQLNSESTKHLVLEQWDFYAISNSNEQWKSEIENIELSCINENKVVLLIRTEQK